MGLNNMENLGSLEITRYKYRFVDGQPKIVIEMVKAIDTNGKYIKFLPMKEVVNYLDKYPVIFKPLES